MTRDKRSPNRRLGSVYEQLRDQVVHGSFRPGEQLFIEQLAERLNSSATPVREALVRLHAERLVGAVPSRGYFAKILCEREVAARLELVALILEHAVAHPDQSPEGGSEEPEALAPGAATAQDDESCALAVEALFERIAARSGNPVMVKTMRSLNLQLRHVRLIYLEDPADGERVRAGLAALAEAVRSGRPDAARMALRAHLDHFSGQLQALVNEVNARALMGAGGRRAGQRGMPPGGRTPFTPSSPRTA